MPAFLHVDDVSLDRTYLIGAARGLAAEFERARALVDRADDDASSLLALADQVARMDPRMLAAAWATLWERLDVAADRLTSGRNAGATYAREYDSMAEFFADAEQQRLGRSDHTFWDTYEHGRRRQLEAAFAAHRGHDAALLVNSGMSAISVALETASLGPGDRILTGRNAYFETAQLLDGYAARGVEVRKVDLADGRDWAACVREGASVILVETVENGPAGQPCPDPRSWLRDAAARLILVDNSVQATHVDWAHIAKDGRQCETLLVAESCAKYLTPSIVAGVVFGTAAAVERAREVARNHGQHLQERLFNHLRAWEMAELGTRLAIHSRNVRRFHERLQQGPASRLPMFRSVDARGGRRWPFDRGVGSLVYVRLGACRVTGSEAARHRRFLDRWVRLARSAGCPVAIRAGFGWRRTSARCYEGQYLNQAQATDYMRVSLGIEPMGRVDAIAAAFGGALESLKETPA